MELLDIYDENENHIGTEERSIVHRDALWHKTVHCWLYDKEGNIYFQIRKDKGKLYTTASGHIKAGESVKEGFGREIEEEIGIKVDYEQARLVDVVRFIMDREEPDGRVFRDRAFANVYVLDFESPIEEFNFDEEEILGLVKIDAVETLELLKRENGSIEGTLIVKENGKNVAKKEEIPFEKFLVNPGETALGKYGDVLNKVISLTEQETA